MMMRPYFDASLTKSLARFRNCRKRSRSSSWISEISSWNSEFHCRVYRVFSVAAGSPSEESRRLGEEEEEENGGRGEDARKCRRSLAKIGLFCTCWWRKVRNAGGTRQSCAAEKYVESCTDADGPKSNGEDWADLMEKGATT